MLEEEEEDIDWQIEQEPYEEAAPSLTDPKYGFASQRSGVFKRLQVMPWLLLYNTWVNQVEVSF